MCKILQVTEITEPMEVLEAQCSTVEEAEASGIRKAENFTRRGFPYKFVGVIYDEYTVTVDANRYGMDGRPPLPGLPGSWAIRHEDHTHRGYRPVVVPVQAQ